MRDIKFRVRLKARVDFGSMREGEILTMNVSLFDKQNGLAYWALNDKVWELLSSDEYTGLKDKNGKEIYEGDIICFPKRNITDPCDLETNEISPVCFQFGGFRLGNPNIIGVREELEGYNEYAEIIGNIYENSELLKQAI